MSIVSVDNIQPIGSGTSVTVNSAATLVLNNVSIAGVTTFGNNITASGTSRFEIASIENALLDGEIAHTGDTDTLIKFPANDTISFETAGTERLRIKSNGQIVLGSDGTNSELTFSQDGTSGTILNSTTTGFGGYNTFTVNSAQFVHKYGSNERLRIDSSGDVKVATGDIYFATAGKGIVLGTTSNTDAHTLDHYQEGTTGLTVKCGSVTVPLLNNTCKWTRIGNTLHLSAWIRISGGTSASGISATDPVKITGFPFATVGNSTGRTRLVFTGYSFGNVSNVTWGWMVVGDGATSTEHELHWGNLNFSTITAPDGNNITSGGNYLSSEIYLNGHMFV